MTHNEILELIWNYLPDYNDYGLEMDYYPARDNLPEAEMYFRKDGLCYKIVIEDHPHV